MHYFIKAYLPSKQRQYWLYTDASKAVLNASALFAEPIEAQYVQSMLRMVCALWPGCSVQAVECNSNKLIPENMRKVLNIA